MFKIKDFIDYLPKNEISFVALEKECVNFIIEKGLPEAPACIILKFSHKNERHIIGIGIWLLEKENPVTFTKELYYKKINFMPPKYKTLYEKSDEMKIEIKNIFHFVTASYQIREIAINFEDLEMFIKKSDERFSLENRKLINKTLTIMDNIFRKTIYFKCDVFNPQTKMSSKFSESISFIDIINFPKDVEEELKKNNKAVLNL
ncbi:MAG: hypothetical protein QM535_19245 [Limnohabitans sp.]|nr:hypothetical protein [Limnohabitans sp.]